MIEHLGKLVFIKTHDGSLYKGTVGLRSLDKVKGCLSLLKQARNGSEDAQSWGYESVPLKDIKEISIGEGRQRCTYRGL